MEPVEVSKNQKLYDNLIGSKRVTADQIGDFGTFNTMLADSANAVKLHGNLIKSGGFKESEIGNENDFLGNIDPIKPIAAPEPVAQAPIAETHVNTQTETIPGQDDFFSDGPTKPAIPAPKFTEHPLDYLSNATKNAGKAFVSTGKVALAETGLAVLDQGKIINGWLKSISSNPSWQKQIAGDEKDIDDNIVSLHKFKASADKMSGKPGEFIGSMVPFAAMAAGSILAKSPQLAMTTTTLFAEMGYGSGIEAYDEHKAATKQPIDEAERTGAGILYGAAMSLPMSGYIGKMMPKGLFKKAISETLGANPEAVAGLGKEIFEAFAKKSPGLAKQLLTVSAKGAAHGVAAMETMELSKKAVDQFLIGRNVSPTEWWDTIKGAAGSGAMFGLMTAPFSMIAQNSATTQRRNAQGSVTLSKDANGKPVEIIPSKDGKQQGMTPDGKIVDVTEQQIKDSFTLPTIQFNEAIDHFKKSGEVSPTIERDAFSGRVTEMTNRLSDKDGNVYTAQDQAGNNYYLVGKDAQGGNIVVDSNGKQGTADQSLDWQKVNKGEVWQSLMNNFDAKATPQAEQPTQQAIPAPVLDPRQQAEQNLRDFHQQHADKDSGMLRVIGQTTPDGEDTKNWFIIKEVDGGEGNQFYIVEDGEGGHESLTKAQVTGDIQETNVEDFVNKGMTGFDQQQAGEVQAEQNQMTRDGEVLTRIPDDGGKGAKTEVWETQDGRYVEVPNEEVAAWEQSKQNDPNSNPNIVNRTFGKTQVTGVKDQSGNIVLSEPMTLDQVDALKAEVERTTGGKATVQMAQITTGNDGTLQDTYEATITPVAAAPVIDPAIQAQVEAETKPSYTLSGKPIDRSQVQSRITTAIFLKDQKKIAGLVINNDPELTAQIDKAFPKPKAKFTIGNKSATKDITLAWIDSADDLSDLQLLKHENIEAEPEVKAAYDAKMLEFVPEVPAQSEVNLPLDTPVTQQNGSEVAVNLPIAQEEVNPQVDLSNANAQYIDRVLEYINDKYGVNYNRSYFKPNGKIADIKKIQKFAKNYLPSSEQRKFINSFSESIEPPVVEQTTSDVKDVSKKKNEGPSAERVAPDALTPEPVIKESLSTEPSKTPSKPVEITPVLDIRSEIESAGLVITETGGRFYINTPKIARGNSLQEAYDNAKENEPGVFGRLINEASKKEQPVKKEDKKIGAPINTPINTPISKPVKTSSQVGGRGGSNSLSADVEEYADGTYKITTDDNVVYELPQGKIELLKINGKKATEKQLLSRVGGGIQLKHAIESTIAEHQLETDEEYQKIKGDAFTEEYNAAIKSVTENETIMFQAAGREGNMWVESKIKINKDGSVTITPLTDGVVDKKEYQWSPDVFVSEYKDRFEPTPNPNGQQGNSAEIGSPDQQGGEQRLPDSDNGTEKRVKKTKRQSGSDTPKVKKPLSKIQVEALAIEVDPTDVHGLAMQYFIVGNRINKQALQSLYGNKENNERDRAVFAEQQKRVSYYSPNGQSVDEIAHSLWEANLTDTNEESQTTQDYREAVEEIIKNYNHPATMARDFVKSYTRKESQFSDEEIADMGINAILETPLDEEVIAVVDELPDVADQFDSGLGDWMGAEPADLNEFEKLFPDDKKDIDTGGKTNQSKGTEGHNSNKAVEGVTEKEVTPVQNGLFGDNPIELTAEQKRIEELLKDAEPEPKKAALKAIEAIEQELTDKASELKQAQADQKAARKQAKIEREKPNTGMFGENLVDSSPLLKKLDALVGKYQREYMALTENRPILIDRAVKNAIEAEKAQVKLVIPEVQKPLMEVLADGKKKVEAKQQDNPSTPSKDGVKPVIEQSDNPSLKNSPINNKNNESTSKENGQDRKEVPGQQISTEANAKGQNVNEADEKGLLKSDLNVGDAERVPDVKETISEIGTPAPSKEIAKPKIEDFGEKILGAKKDRLHEISQFAKDATVENLIANPLSKVFPEPDYAKMIEAGQITTSQASSMKVLRNQIPTKPKKAYRIKNWATQAKQFIDLIDDLAANRGFFDKIEGKTFDDFVNKFIAKSGMVQEGDKMILEKHFYDHVGYDTNISGYAIRKFTGDQPFTILRENVIKGRFATEQEAFEGLKKILDESKGTPKETNFSSYQDRNTKDFFIGYKAGTTVVRIKEGFASYADTRAFIKDHRAEIEADLKQLREIPDERKATNSPRLGTDYRNGKDVSPEQFSETFGFRGTQFGNYVENARRIQDLNEAYDALMDLANVLNIPPKAISLSGQLGIAFGARGSGKYAAHYESGEIVINITKTRGAGSLAHEWFHAIDNYFMREDNHKGDFITDMAKQRSARLARDASYSTTRPELLEAFAKLNDAVDKTGLYSRSSKLDTTRSKNYWGTRIEMSARAFEWYIKNRIESQGGQNDYLANMKSQEMWENVQSMFGGYKSAYPYPTNSEAKVISDAFDNLFKVIETKEEGGNTAMFAVKAFHGAPHSFDKFSTDFMGTGEGAQAYGWGLYFTDKKDIAEGYANKLGKFDPDGMGSLNDYADRIMIDGKTATEVGIDTDRTLFDIIRAKGTDSHGYNDWKKYVSDSITKWENLSKDENYPFKDYAIGQASKLNGLLSAKKVEFDTKRNLYSVTLHEGKEASEYDYLRWDKELTKPQLDKIEKSIKIEHPNFDWENIGLDYSDMTNAFGDEIYHSLSKYFEDFTNSPKEAEQEASLFLLRAGIDGIQYPSEYLSKGTQEDSFNYVVFDENAITVNEHAMFSIIGERGAAHIEGLIDNLNVAKAMTEAGKDKETIFLSTGWELFKDGWKYDQTEDFATRNYVGAFEFNQAVKAEKAIEELNAKKDYNTDREKLIDELESFYASIGQDFMTSDQAIHKAIKESLLSGDKSLLPLATLSRSIQNASKRSPFGVAKLGGILQGNKLFDAYPELKDTRVWFDDIPQIARFQEATNEIEISNKVKNDDITVKSALTHEIQHYIQGKEGFAKGGGTNSLNIAVKKAYEGKNIIGKLDAIRFIAKIKDKTFQNVMDKAKELPYIYETANVSDVMWMMKRGEISEADINEIIKLNDIKATEYYNNLAGEVEARNAQSRLNLTPEQRKEQLISATQDVAEDQKIYLMDAIDRAYSIGSPKHNRVTDIVKQLSDQTLNGYNTEVFSNNEEMLNAYRNNGATPKNIKRLEEALKYGDIYAFYDHDTRSIYMLSENMQSDNDIKRNFIHETIHGVNKDHFGRDYNTVMEMIYGKTPQRSMRNVLPSGYWGDSAIIKGDEYLAHLAGEAVIKGTYNPADILTDKEIEDGIFDSTELNDIFVNKLINTLIHESGYKESDNRTSLPGRANNNDGSNSGEIRKAIGDTEGKEGRNDGSIRNNEGGKVNELASNIQESGRGVRQKEQSDSLGSKGGTIGLHENSSIGGVSSGLGQGRVLSGDRAGQSSESSLGKNQKVKPIEQILSEAHDITVAKRANKTVPSTIKVDGISRTTTNSKGQVIHPTIEGIKNFWKWFGDSKVVDSEGRPLAVYHGTIQNFNTFRIGDIGFHFGTKEQAETRIEGEDSAKLMETYLKINNPLESEYDYGSWDGDYLANMFIEREVFEDSADISILKGIEKLSGDRANSELRKFLKSKGYDGVMYKNTFEADYSDNENSYIAFSPNQIKSTTGNSGSFSPNDNNINFAVSRNRPLLDVLKDAKDKILDKKKYVPGVTEVSETVSNFSDALSTTLSPTTKNTGSKDASESLRSNLGTMQRNLDRASARLRQAEKRFNKMSNEENTTFIDNMERDLPQSTPELQGYSDALRKALDDARENVQGLGTGKLENFIENYFPHYWEDSKKASSLLTGVGRRPLEGSKSFLKQRTIEFFADGIEKDLIPVSWNPVKLTIMKIREMERYTMAHTTMIELKQAGYVVFARTGRPMPEGFTTIDDKIGIVRRLNPDTHMLEELGHYYAQENVALILNNFLSKGLRGNMVYDIYRGLGNAITQLQLGLSAFHLGFTSMDAAISKQALGWEYLYHGNVGEAIKHFLLTPVAPVANIIHGSKLRHAWMGTHGFDFMEKWFGDSNSPEMKMIADFMEQAGGRAKMDDFYKEGWMDKIRENVRNHRYASALIDVPMQIIEVTSKPILQYIVPRQKLGVFMDMVRYDLKVHPNSTYEERRTAMQKAWDSVDNRMGQLVYDNLFWNHVTKDVAMATVRSVGWNLGTFREVGGAPKEAVNVLWDAAHGKTATNTHKLAYMISLVATTAISSAIFQFLRTGKPPEEPRDYFFPKDGGTDKNGDNTRVSMPSYVKDLYHYGNDFPSGAANTLKNKLSPVNGIVAQMMSNKDYYGTKIWNEDDAAIEKTKDIFSYMGQQMVPFGIRNIQKNTSDNMIDKVLPFIGIVPAPYDLNMTDAEKKISEMVREKLPIGGRTKEQTDHSKLKLELRNEYSKTKDKSSLVESLHNKDITLDEYHDIKDDSKLSPIQRSSKNLSITELFEIYKIGTPKEKELITPILRKKIRHRVIKGRLNNIEKEEIKNIKSYLQ